MNFNKYVVIFFVGLLVGKSLPEGFFRPWYGHDMDLYRGDSVRFNVPFDNLNSCRKKTVIARQAAHDSNRVWVLLQDCPGLNNLITIDFNELNLERSYE